MKKADNPRNKTEFVPLTREEIREATAKRIDAIQQEFKDGFELISKHPKSVTFFGSARLSEDHTAYKTAVRLAHKIVDELGYSILTGGGPGIMEAGNRGAHEASGNSLGLQIKLPREQETNPYITEGVHFDYFFSRKVCLSFSAEAYVYFPGGFGTFDELFEILTLIQTGKIAKVPVILVGKNFWKHFDKLATRLLAKKKLIDASDIDLYTITDDLDEVVEHIKQAPIRNGIRFHTKK